jgi:hypothetical protein
LPVPVVVPLSALVEKSAAVSSLRRTVPCVSAARRRGGSDRNAGFARGGTLTNLPTDQEQALRVADGIEIG